MFTIADLIYLFVEPSIQHIKIYDSENDYKVVYDGMAEYIPDSLEDKEIQTIDCIDENTPYIGINI